VKIISLKFFLMKRSDSYFMTNTTGKSPCKGTFLNNSKEPYYPTNMFDSGFYYFLIQILAIQFLFFKDDSRILNTHLDKFTSISDAGITPLKTDILKLFRRWKFFFRNLKYCLFGLNIFRDNCGNI
jgi:hypothetical protein